MGDARVPRNPTEIEILGKRAEAPPITVFGIPDLSRRESRVYTASSQHFPRWRLPLASPARRPPDDRCYDLEAKASWPSTRRLGARDRHFRDPDRAAQEGQGRRKAIRRDAPSPRHLRSTLRQRAASRR